MTEFVGIIASILIVVSFVFDGERSIRWANMLGSIVFVAYGIMAHAWSTATCNAALILVNTYKLRRKDG